MLSIVIPLHNYNVANLVNKLQQEAFYISEKVEILVLDDASTKFKEDNDRLASLEGVHFFSMAQNVGRTKAREILAEKASYNWLLFLDADVLPVQENYIKTYLNALKKYNSGCFFGGIVYEKNPPTKSQYLRWFYGKNREEIEVSKRTKKTYLTINSGAFLIEKKVFLKLSNYLGSINKYGLDLYFKVLLEKENIPIYHIKNPVFHLGLETSEAFLKKSLKAVETLYFLEKNKYITTNKYPLQRAYITVNNTFLYIPFMFFFKAFKNSILKNLNSNQPSLLLLDLYKLAHYITLKRG